MTASRPLALVAALALLAVAAPAGAEGARPLTAEAVAAWAAEVVPPALEAGQIPGALLAVVHGGKVLLAGGYGVESVDTGRAVDGGRTLFRVGSVSKVVTATAVVRLAETGALDLDADVRATLPDLPLSHGFEAPMTASQLLTHSSGLDVSDLGDASEDLAGVLSLHAFLTERGVPRFAPPGTRFRYTNHGYALLGVLVETVTSSPFDAAMADLVFAPLSMTRSTFAQPAPEALAADVAHGHALRDGALVTLPMDYSNVAPADAMLTTAGDMGRFLLAHLTSAAPRVLGPAARAQMHGTAFTYHPELPGRALGLDEQRVGATRDVPGPRRLLAHTGGQLGFTSELVLIPEADLGLFMVLNRRDWRVRRQVFDQLLATFVPFEAPPAVERPTAPGTAPEVLVGRWERERVPADGIEGIGALLEPAPIDLLLGADGQLLVGDTELWPRGRGLFTSADGAVLLAVPPAAGAPPIWVAFDGDVHERRAWHEAPSVHAAGLAVSLALLLFGLVAGPLGRWWRRRRVEETPRERRLGRLAALTSLGLLGWCFWFVATLVALADTGGFDYGVPQSLAVVRWAAWLVLALAVVLAARVVESWVRGAWGPVLRVAHSLTAAAALVLVSILLAWDVLP